MKWLILLVAGLAAGENQHELAERIAVTEQECNRLYQINENWNTNNFNEQAALFFDLFFICEDSLAEDKYKYIDHNYVDISNFTAEQETFPVMTSKGEQLVKKPPARTTEDVESMEETFRQSLLKQGGEHNPLYKLTKIQSELGQEIVDEQVRCELLGLLLLRHPEDEDTAKQHTECIDSLNCIKERFMEQHNFGLDEYPNVFPILYKGRGTMINSPPRSDGTSLCVQPSRLFDYKKELQKWKEVMGKLHSAGQSAEEAVEGVENTGNKLIVALKNMGMSGAPRLLPRKPNDEVVPDVLVEDVENKTRSALNVAANYEDETSDQLDTSTNEDHENINSKDFEHLNEIKTNTLFNPVDKMALEAWDYLKKLEADKLRTITENTMKSFIDGESEVKTKSEDALEEIKERVGVINDATELAATKIKEDSSIFLEKLKEKIQNKPEPSGERENVDQLNENDGGWLRGFVKNIAQEYLPKHFDKLQTPTVNKLLEKIGTHNENGEDMLTDERVLDMLSTLEKDIKEKAENTNMHHKNEVKQAAIAFSGILHSVLDAGLKGYGPAKDLDSEEIEHAKSLLNIVERSFNVNGEVNDLEAKHLEGAVDELNDPEISSTSEKVEDSKDALEEYAKSNDNEEEGKGPNVQHDLLSSKDKEVEPSAEIIDLTLDDSEEKETEDFQDQGSENAKSPEGE